MLKSSRQAGSLAKRIIIILIMSVLLLSAAACNRKGPPKSGILTDDYELTIEGEVVFTMVFFMLLFVFCIVAKLQKICNGCLQV